MTLKQMQNYVVHRETVLPITAEVGQLMLRSTDNKLFVYTSTGWKAVGNT
jgi:hypothetical protein